MNAFLKFFKGNKIFQKFYETMYIASLYGMNYGSIGDFSDNGEENTLKFIKSKISPKDSITLFDVGANSGHYSELLAQIFSDRNYTIHAFEPSKSIFTSMHYMLSANKNIIANNMGLGEKQEIITLYADAEMSGLRSAYKRRLDYAGIDMSHKEEVTIETIDNYCQKNKIQKINFLKMDVEGHEFKCLLGATEMLTQKKIDFIQFEFGGCNIDAKIFFQDFWYLLNENYRLYRIVRNGFVLIENYKERFEIFKNINYLAQRKDL